jgi:MFS family permease
VNLVERDTSKLEGGSLNVAEKKKSLWKDWHIASLYIAIAVSWIGYGVVAPLRTLYARSEGASGTEVGLMASMYVISSFLFLFPFGWVSDRWNRVAMIALGLVADVFITLGFLFFTSSEAFIALRFAEGVAGAAVLPATRALLADLVPKGRNGEAFGTMSAMMTFGLFAGPPVGTFLADIVGYTAAYWVAAASFIPALILVLYAFRNFDQKAYRKQPPAKWVEAKGKPVKVKKESLWTGPIIIGCLVRVSMGLGPGIGTSIWSIYMADLGYSLSLIGWTYTVYAIPIVLIAPMAGRISDRYGRLLMMLGPSLILGLLWVSYGAIPFFLYFMFMGIVEGAFDAVSRSANDGYLADNTPNGSRGRAQGLFNAASQFGTLVGAMAAGVLYEYGHSTPFTVVGGLQSSLIVVAIILAFFVHSRRKLSPVEATS